ncbi:MAG TPA: primosomal replication protein N [Methyloradius sp.]
MSEKLATNQLVITGEIVQIAEFRYTPAGIPVLSFEIRHVSEQIEADMQRRVECEMSVIAMGKLAEQIRNIKLGEMVQLTGFMTKRSLKSTQLTLHLNTLERIN